MMRKQQGFTLIELVAVIVILGALAVVALPRFINLQDEAQLAAAEGVAGSAAAGHAVNLAGALADSGDEEQVTQCSDTNLVLQGGSPDGYTFADETGGTQGTATGETLDCEVEQDLDGDGTAENTVTFTGYYVSG